MTDNNGITDKRRDYVLFYIPAREGCLPSLPECLAIPCDIRSKVFYCSFIRGIPQDDPAPSRELISRLAFSQHHDSGVTFLGAFQRVFGKLPDQCVAGEFYHFGSERFGVCLGIFQQNSESEFRFY